MKKTLKLILTSIFSLGGAIILSAVRTNTASALTVQEGAEAARADGMPYDLIGPDGVFTQVTNTVLYIVGIVSVIMLIYGGLRYVISGGDSKKVTDAKNTILYAIIGLIISILAFAIVNFVINAITGESKSAANTNSLDSTSQEEQKTE